MAIMQNERNNVCQATEEVSQLNCEIKRQAAELAILAGRLEYERKEFRKKIEALKLSFTLISGQTSSDCFHKERLSIEGDRMNPFIANLIEAINNVIDGKFFIFNKKRLLHQIIRSAKIVDEKWYLSNNSDVVAKKAHPVRHYIEHGVTEGRAPRPLFEV